MKYGIISRDDLNTGNYPDSILIRGPIGSINLLDSSISLTNKAFIVGFWEDANIQEVYTEDLDLFKSKVEYHLSYASYGGENLFSIQFFEDSYNSEHLQDMYMRINLPSNLIDKYNI